MTSLPEKQTGASLLFSTPHHQTPWAALASFISTKIQQRTNRTAFREMLELSPHLLKDIGVTYWDVRRAANLPMEIDAANELCKYTRSRPKLL